MKEFLFVAVLVLIISATTGQNLTCNFDHNNLCQWTQVTGTADKANWNLRRGPTPSRSTGPTADHTTNSSVGYYIYATASIRHANQTARIQSPHIRPGGHRQCFSFWYHMYGPNIGTLNLYVQTRPSLDRPTWTRKGSKGNHWIQGQITLPNTGSYSLVFESIGGNGFRGDVAIDDTKLTAGSCSAINVGTTPRPGSQAARPCTFESPAICGYTQDTSDQFQWTRANGRTGTSGSGPTMDHTYGTFQGYYMFIETSAPHKAGDNARLISPRYRDSAAVCVQFWYHMYGNGIGTLNVYAMTGTQRGRPIFTMAGNQDNKWVVGTASVPASTATHGYKIVFEAIRGTNYRCDIAIDDISFSSGACPIPGNCNFEAGLCLWSNTNTGDDFDWTQGTKGTLTGSTGPTADHTTGRAAGNCNFEGSMCGWTNSQTDDFDWISMLGNYTGTYRVPIGDHTYGSRRGTYMYVGSNSPCVQGYIADLVSPSMPPTSRSGKCVKFWFLFSSRNSIGTLSAQVMQNQPAVAVWLLSSIPNVNQPNQWIQGQFPVVSTTGYQIVFEVTRGAFANGYVVLDDVTFTTGLCQTNPASAMTGVTSTSIPTTTMAAGVTQATSIYDCTFESGFCTWVQARNDQFDWTRTHGSTNSGRTGPSTDHTLGNGAGYYIFIEASSPRRLNDTARIMSSTVTVTTQKCLHFWYHMYGTHVNTLNVYLQVGTSLGAPVWTHTGTLSNKWYNANVDIQKGTSYKIVFEGVRGTNYRGDIGLDDISVSDGLCSGGQVCTFEDPRICGYQQDQQDQFDWTRASVSTSSFGTGPRSDHTYGTAAGSYMYTEASNKRPGMKARLIGQSNPPTTGTCLQFYYHMYGRTMGTLNVYTRTGNSIGNPIWARSHNHGNRWLQAQLTVVSQANWQPVFEGVIGSGFTSDIAIDDVKLSSGSCMGAKGSCSFENGMCAWTNTRAGDDFDWLQTQGHTGGIFSSSPHADHTIGTFLGHYLYIETSSPRVQGDKAWFLSPSFNSATTSQCLTFWYHMYGAGIGSLNVYLKRNSVAPKLLWTQFGNKGNNWLQGQVPLAPVTTSYQVYFEGIRGRSFNGDIAIDDISFKTTACGFAPANAAPVGVSTVTPSRSPTPPTHTTRTTRSTSPTTRTTTARPTDCQMMAEVTLPPKLTTAYVCGPGRSPCTNGQCIPSNSFCNFRYECTDNSDESNCPRFVTFESGTLEHWYNDPTQNAFTWTVNSKGNPTALTGPIADHTRAIASGHFALLKGQVNTSSQLVSRLVSPVYNQAGKTCNFTFSYNVHGREFSMVTVYIRHGSAESNIWSIGSTAFTGVQDTWQTAQVVLPICASQFQVIIEVLALGTMGVAPGFVAIDDLRFMNCEYPTAPPTCMMGQYQCRSGHCIPQTSTCNYQTDCRDGSDEIKSVCAGYTMCDFEFGMCGWQQSTNDQFDWRRSRGPTSSYGTGPTKDHTSGSIKDQTSGSASGYYLFIESSQPRMPNDTARITFNLPAPIGVCAIRFWYHMYGANIGALNVYMNTLNNGTVLKSAINGKQGNSWLLTSVTLDSTTPFQVVIEGVTGIGYHGDIAIDDISLTPGCGVPTTGASPITYHTTQQPTSTPNPCGFGQYTCSSGQCIAVSLACNSVPDCRDGSDEENCPQACSFENDQCGWMEIITDDLDWVRASGSQISIAGLTNFAPTIDNTRHTQNGYFMYVNNSATGSTYGKVAQLGSPTLYTPEQNCKVQFAYYLNGNDKGTMALKLQQAGSPEIPLWQRYETTGSKWTTVIVGVGKRTAPFNLMFSRTSQQYSGQSAIDDIQYLDCKPPAPQNFCPDSKFKCANKACVDRQVVCDMTWDCGDKSDETHCTGYRFNNFENGMGDLVQVSNGDDDFDWNTASTVRNVSSFPGPVFDHTFGTQHGKYLYIDSTNQVFNSIAWLRTPTFQPVAANANCRIRLYLFMYGRNVNTLNVWYRIYNSGPPTQAIYTSTREQGSYWLSINRQLIVSQPFQITIEAKAGHKDVGGVAIDDLSFTPGCGIPTAAQQLPTPPTTISTTARPTTTASKNNCTLNQFVCTSDFSCIDSKRVCDFRSDCVDNSDETNCVASNCGFDNQQTCGWSISSSKTARHDEIYLWRVLVAQNVQDTVYAPTNDHTEGTPQGSFALATSTTGSFHNTTELYTPTIRSTGPQCRFKFYYYIDGPDVDALSVKINIKGITSWLWEITGSRGRIWQVADIFIGAKINALLTVQARRSSSYSGVIAVDDLQFIDCQPPLATPTCQKNMFTCKNQYCINPVLRCNYADDCGDGSDEIQQECDLQYHGRCDFSQGICNDWSNDIDDDFDWTFARGSTPTLGTGPSVDHTSRHAMGGYIYTDSSPPRKTGDAARLSSYVISGRSQNCVLRLWYHMWGSQIGYLTVQKRYNYTSTGLSPVQHMSNDHGDDWHLLAVPLNTGSNHDYQVVIQGTVGKGIHNDIAIDDLSMTPGCEMGEGPLPGAPTPPTTTVGVCGVGQKKCATTTKCYTFAQECDFIDGCGDNSDEATCGTNCDFEHNACGWKNSLKDNINWLIQSGHNAGRTRPDRDHTTNSHQGHYFITQYRPNTTMGNTAIVESSIYFESSPSCVVNFWYNSFGSAGSLLVLGMKTSQRQNNLWSAPTNKSVNWQKASVVIGSYNQFALVMEVIFPTRSTAMIAIDDITFSKCAPVSEVRACKITQFLCGNRIDCIERRYRCDGHTDCSDGTDEDACIPNPGDCDFNSDIWLFLCSWKQRRDDDGDWAQSSYRINQRTGADVDHKGTYNSYFLTSNSEHMNPGDVAEVQGPLFPASHNLCYVRFSYYMYGASNIGPLRVYTYNTDEEKTLMWSVSGNKHQTWKYANVLVGNNKNFSVLFEATSGKVAMSDIAIDDVSFTPECATGQNITIPTIPVCNTQISFLCVPRQQCLPNSWKCDGVMDCSNGIDEPPSCPTRPTLPSSATTPTPKTLPPTTSEVTAPVQPHCPHGQFQCANKQCIPGIMQCDTVKDCTDGTDEVQCQTCKVNFVYCRHQRLCIRNDTLCDHNDDCGDASDESLCKPGCPPNFCQNQGTCVPGASPPACTCVSPYVGMRCQYKAPVAQTSSQPTTSVVTAPVQPHCPHGQFQCANKQCIPGILQCDTVKDCTDGTDEVQCPTCKVNFLYCRHQRLCIRNDTLCDHNDDCGDASDESLCKPGCPPNFCQNQATCVLGASPPACTCVGPHVGMRCQYKDPGAQRSSQSSGTGWKVGVGVSVGLVGMILIVVGAFFFMKRRRALLFFRNVSSEGGLSNPVYDGYGTDNMVTTDFQISWTTRACP